jgi:hypothetical protein
MRLHEGVAVHESTASCRQPSPVLLAAGVLTG